MATIKEVSRHANVSPSTVSRVLNDTAIVNEETKQRVLDAIELLNYKPNVFARGLSTKRSGSIGVIVNELSSHYYTQLIKGIEEVIEAADMHLVVSSGHREATLESKAIHYLKQRQVDALVMHLEYTPDEQILDWLDSENGEFADTPIILIGRHLFELPEICVHLDNEKGGYLATKYLIEQGHTKIAHISGPLAMKDSHDRLQGYRKALESAGLAYDSRFVINSSFSIESGQQAAKRLLERNLDVSAIFSANDAMAIGILHTLRESNISVPNDISLVGFDDATISKYLYPPLTTIRQPLLDMGRAAGKLVLCTLNNSNTNNQNFFEPQLIVRNSVKAICK